MPGDNSYIDYSSAILETDTGIIITFDVSAGAKREVFPSGYNPWRHAIGISVKTPPIEGKANKAIISLLSDVFKISKQQITILSGATSSIKRVQIEDLSSDIVHLILKERFDTLLSQ